MAIPPEGRVFLIDKPVGPTSFDIVARVRRIVGERRVGHTGTLDPLASGLLPVCVGECTKLVPYLTDCDKRYAATVRLGLETASGDVDAPVAFEAPAGAAEAVADAAVERAVAALRGTIEQRPPAHSAIKVDGRPLYERARRGEEVEVPTRVVRIDAFEIVARRGVDLDVEVACSKGTYIRSLAIDLGRALGVGAHLVALRRTAVGAFSIGQALTLDALAEAVRADPTVGLRPAAALGHLPCAVVDAATELALRQGKTPSIAAAEGTLLAVNAAGVAVALVEAAATELSGTVRLRVLRGFQALAP